MFGSDILEVAIGVIFVYILVSVICTAVREIIEAWLKTRAAYLERGIRELLRDREGTGLAKAVYEHPLIASLHAGDYRVGDTGPKPRLLASGRGLPSYIPARNFALVLMDIAARGPVTDEVSSDPASPPISMATVRANLMNIDNAGVRRVLLTALDSAQGDLNRAVLAVEDWFDSGMDRVSGWYKRTSHWIVFWTALAIVAALNVDTLRIADFLYRNDAVRAAMVARAETAVADTAFLRRSYEDTRAEIDALELPLGWGADATRALPDGRRPTPSDPLAWLLWIVFNGVFSLPGWLLTAFAATLGAPFWFDVLNKVMVIRGTVKPKEKSPEEGSEDRQTSASKQTRVLEEAALAAGPALAAAGAAGAVRGGVAPAPHEVLPTPRDAESAVDACDIVLAAEESTPDEDLPPAEGGVENHG